MEKRKGGKGLFWYRAWTKSNGYKFLVKPQNVKQGIQNVKIVWAKGFGLE
jgi:hypothetical protein